MKKRTAILKVRSLCDREESGFDDNLSLSAQYQSFYDNTSLGTMRHAVSAQLDMFEATEPKSAVEQRVNTTSTFTDNLSQPIHRWFRYSAGFSATWAREVIEHQKSNGRRTVLDPFAGSGTTVIEAESAGLSSVGIESHPFIARVGRTKLEWRSDIAAFRRLATQVLECAEANSEVWHQRKVPKLLVQCFPSPVLQRLFALRSAWTNLHDATAASEITWLALIAILRECSPVGTAQWQYVLPNKSKARNADPFTAFNAKISLFAKDMASRQAFPAGAPAEIRWEDARICQSVPNGWADLVITSPPYANNYDYADATRLEMTFTGEIDGWGDLQQKVRKYLMRSCSQHVAPLVAQTEEMLQAAFLDPIRPEITEVCRRLDVERNLHGGKKAYHTMIAAYFSDMANVWTSLRRVTRSGALVCFVVGDSAPYGIHVPVDRWLGVLAVAAGFDSFFFEKTRDRNIKWKNRKHRVPLHEGRLWVKG